ncbi:hypothetical protein BKA62DRAFT_121188 [Auriculariales sp. MPI-PUGE-AT-0066]|nr:hypothetical protein BKA62DRAFT_121188 [Auriculariales sp. MPI-PUGE-AT-0066]
MALRNSSWILPVVSDCLKPYQLLRVGFGWASCIVANFYLGPRMSLLRLTSISYIHRPKLSTSLAVYEGFKVVVQGLANMTDGAPWPWKAIPQMMLQFASMVERALDQPHKLQDLVGNIARILQLPRQPRSEGTRTSYECPRISHQSTAISAPSCCT